MYSIAFNEKEPIKFKTLEDVVQWIYKNSSLVYNEIFNSSEKALSSVKVEVGSVTGYLGKDLRWRDYYTISHPGQDSSTEQDLSFNLLYTIEDVILRVYNHASQWKNMSFDLDDDVLPF